jgi:hypothetical protein
MNGLPIWVKAAGVVGIPGVIALILLYIVNATLASQVKAHEVLTHEAQAAFQRLLAHDENTMRQTELLERICRRLGKNDFEREVCR